MALYNYKCRANILFMKRFQKHIAFTVMTMTVDSIRPEKWIIFIFLL